MLIICDINIEIDFSILVKKRCLMFKETISFGTVMSVCVCARGVYSCLINQRHMECDCMQWGVYVPVFHTGVRQTAVPAQYRVYNYMVLYPRRP